MALNYAYNYADIDPDTGECFGVRTTTYEINHPQLVPIPTDSEDYIGKYYLNGNWYEDAEGTIPWTPPV